MRPTTQMSDCRGGRGRSPWAAAAKKIVRTRSAAVWTRGNFRRFSRHPRGNSSAGRPAGRRRGVGPSADFKCGKVNSACVPRPGVARAHVGGRAARPPKRKDAIRRRVQIASESRWKRGRFSTASAVGSGRVLVQSEESDVYCHAVRMRNPPAAPARSGGKSMDPTGSAPATNGWSMVTVPSMGSSFASEVCQSWGRHLHGADALLSGG